MKAITLCLFGPKDMGNTAVEHEDTIRAVTSVNSCVTPTLITLGIFPLQQLIASVAAYIAKEVIDDQETEIGRPITWNRRQGPSIHVNVWIIRNRQRT